MLLREAVKYRWQINWMGDHSSATGVTVAGKTGWTADPADPQRLYADVSTKMCGYHEVPSYFTAVRGVHNHWKVMGASVIYSPTITGFRLYVLYPGGVTPAQAEAWGWSVAWVGTTDQLLSMTEEVFAGAQRSAWHRKQTKLGQPTAYSDVDTSDSGFMGAPTYIAAISVASNEWEIVGAITMGHAQASGFRLYLGIHNGGESSLSKVSLARSPAAKKLLPEARTF